LAEALPRDQANQILRYLKEKEKKL